MIKKGLFLYFILLGCISYGQVSPTGYLRKANLKLKKELSDPNLGEDGSVLQIRFKGLKRKDRYKSVRYSMNGIEYQAELVASQLKIETKPGTFKMLMLLNADYHEVFTDSILVKGQTVYNYNVKLPRDKSKNRAPNRLPTKNYKPVIYLYPEVEQEVTVQLDVHGEHPFFYPAYKESWNVTAHPNGDLEHEGETYNYLFWESDDEDHLTEINVDAGFSVAGTDAVAFLEEQLKLVGFTSKERADFITFWGPKIASNKHNLVRFEWNETCDKFADIDITPKPDHLYRFYIFISATETATDIQPQQLPRFEREGFVVLEWGGQVSNYQPKNVL